MENCGDFLTNIFRTRNKFVGFESDNKLRLLESYRSDFWALNTKKISSESASKLQIGSYPSAMRWWFTRQMALRSDPMRVQWRLIPQA